MSQVKVSVKFGFSTVIPRNFLPMVTVQEAVLPDSLAEPDTSYQLLE